MKVEETLTIMSLLGTLVQSTKLLKVPRIYNALITSDENLQPSQAYPALAPVVQGIQYPIPGYVNNGVYQSVIVPSQVQYSNTRSYSYSVHNSVKEDHFHYNVVETGQPFKFDIPKIPSDEEKNLEQPAFFRPAVPVRNTIPNDNRMAYFQPGSAQQAESQRAHLPPRPNTSSNSYGVPLQNAPTYREGMKPEQTDSNLDTTIPSELNDESTTSNVEEEPSYGRFSEIDDIIKNNRPKDTDIVDVPPPPLPVGRNSGKKSDEKKVEEFPPSPLGFI